MRVKPFWAISLFALGILAGRGEAGENRAPETRLIEAVKAGDNAGVATLLRQRAPVNAAWRE